MKYIDKIAVFLILMGSATWITGCSKTLMQKSPAFEAPAAVPAFSDPGESTLWEAPVLREKPLPRKNVSMKMHDVPVAVILRALAQAADINIMISSNVKTRASVNIKNAPWEDVYNCVLRTYGLTYTWEGHIIRILTLEDINHELELLDANRKIVEKLRHDSPVVPEDIPVKK